MRDRKRIKNSLIDKTARFYGGFICGSDVRIDRGFHCTAAFVLLGEHIHISPYVVIIGGEDTLFEAKGFNNLMVGSKVICASDRFEGSGLPGSLIPRKFKGKVINKPVVMEKFSNLGSGAIMMPGSRLNTGCLLTINSVLFGDTEEWGVYSGNPAILVKKICGAQIMTIAKEYEAEN
jgi:acetyltransferase-like isoleucine patch superfamily enzyme